MSAAGALAAVSRETMTRLRQLEALVVRWTASVNLVSPADVPHLWARHIVDSAQLFGLAPASAATWVDLGSGGGFPGLVIAAIAAAERPALLVTLVESDQRKCAFLRAAAREIGLRVDVRNKRVEDLGDVTFDVISARALAPLSDLFALSAPLRGPDTVEIYPKGRQAARELAACARDWTFRATHVTSITSPDAIILRVTELRRVEPRR